MYNGYLQVTLGIIGLGAFVYEFQLNPFTYLLSYRSVSYETIYNPSMVMAVVRL